VRHAAHHLVRCSACSLVFAGREPTGEELADYYRDYPVRDTLTRVTAVRYDELLDGFEPYRVTNRIIDVGCGAGLFLERAALRGWEVHGTEYGALAVGACRARGIGIIEGPLAPANYAPPLFDVVCSFEVIEHVVRPREELDRMVRILRPGGLLYLTTPNFDCLARRFTPDDWSVVNYPEHLTYFTPRTLRRMAREAGLLERRLVTTGFSLHRWRAGQSTDKAVETDARAEQEALRERIETRPLLKLAKRITNGLLDLTRAGDSMKAAFEKPGP